MVVSAADKAIYVYRNGNPSGAPRSRSAAGFARRSCVLACSKARPAGKARWLRAAQARRWMSVTSSGRSVDAEKIASRLRINPEFAGKVYDTITPGTTVIVRRYRADVRVVDEVAVAGID